MTKSHPLPADTDVVIIGGGLAGLTTAVGLIGEGLRLTLLEQDERLGGRACSWTDATTGDPVDIGPHILLQSLYPNVDELLERMGTADQVVWEPHRFITLADGASRFDLDVRPWPAPFHLLPWLAAHPRADARDHLSNVPVTLRAMQLDEREMADLDEINAYAFLRKMGVTRRYIEQFWSFICLAIMNVPVELCSAGALIRFYRILIGRNSYRSGFARAGLAHLFVPPAEAMLRAEGHVVRSSARVRSIALEGNRAVGVELDDGQRLRSRFVVAAVPPHALRRLLPAAAVSSHPRFADLATFQGSPYVSCYLWFDRKITDLRFWARSPAQGGLNTDFYDLTNIDPARRHRPSIVASNIIYAHAVSDTPDEEIVARTFDEIGEFIPRASEARLSHWVVNRIPMGIPCPYPGMERRRLATVSGIDGLMLAGDWTATQLPWSMESAARSGWLAAESILDQCHRPKKLAASPRTPEGLVRTVGRIAAARPSRLLARARDAAGAARWR